MKQLNVGRAVAAVATLLGATAAFADKPLLVQSCTRSTLCGATVVQFEEASDYPRRPLFLEPDAVNIAPIGSGSQKLNKYAVNFTGTNFLYSPSGGAFPAGWFTVAVWVYPTTLGSTNQKQYLVSEDGDSVPGNALYLQNQAGSLKAVIDLRDGIDPKNGTHITATSGGDLLRNAWHLLVARLRPKTFISNGELSIQVDNGAPVTASVAVATWGGGGRLFAGKTNQPGSEGYFTGYLDQLAVAGVRWTDEETAYYWNGGAGLQYPFITGRTDCSTPTSHWRLDRLFLPNPPASGAYVIDDASGGNDSVSGGTTATIIASGPFNYAASGDGSTNKINVPDAENLNAYSDPWSVEGWVRFGNLSSSYDVVSKGDGTTSGKGWRVYLNAGTSKLNLAWSDGTSAVTLADTTTISAATWYYFAARFDGNQTYKLSVNGSSGGSTTSTVKQANAATFNFGLGRTKSPGGTPLAGDLSSVSWYKGLALGDSEIGTHYNSGAGRECCPFK